jgi:hypothetical protein
MIKINGELAGADVAERGIEIDLDVIPQLTFSPDSKEMPDGFLQWDVILLPDFDAVVIRGCYPVVEIFELPYFQHSSKPDVKTGGFSQEITEVNRKFVIGNGHQIILGAT